MPLNKEASSEYWSSMLMPALKLKVLLPSIQMLYEASDTKLSDEKIS